MLAIDVDNEGGSYAEEKDSSANVTHSARTLQCNPSVGSEAVCQDGRVCWERSGQRAVLSTGGAADQNDGAVRELQRAGRGHDARSRTTEFVGNEGRPKRPLPVPPVSRERELRLQPASSVLLRAFAQHSRGPRRLPLPGRRGVHVKQPGKASWRGAAYGVEGNHQHAVVLCCGRVNVVWLEHQLLGCRGPICPVGSLVIRHPPVAPHRPGYHAVPLANPIPESKARGLAHPSAREDPFEAVGGGPLQAVGRAPHG
mmetsp:Transcript_13393/g.40189  ORF Transcript_13393/g.40189 Transcript_13393/m.40189 type:complete len:256 (+) Transcript_13393:448-1215(+)